MLARISVGRRALAALLGVAVSAFLVNLPQASAAIAVVTPLSGVDYNTSGSTAISQPFTATGGNVIVVELSDRQAASTALLPSTLTWDGVTLNEAVSQQSLSSSWHNVAIYWGAISSSNTGTFNITGSIPDSTASDITNTYLTAFTLSGVNTAAAVLATGTDSAGVSPDTPPPIANVAAGSFAAVNLNWSQSEPSGVTLAFSVAPSANTTGAWVVSTTGNHDSVGMGYIANLNAGTNTFSATVAGAPTNKSPFVVAVFAPAFVGFSWTGSSGNLWDTSTANWSGGTLGNVYTNGSPVIFSDSGANTGIVITGSGVSPASVLFTNNTAAYSFSGGAISGTASVTLSGTGLVTFSNSNTYTGGTTISAGTLQVGSGGATGTPGSGAVADNGALVFNLSGPATFGGAISGVGSLAQAGTGSLILSGSNTYSGGTTISSGTLNFGNLSALGFGAASFAGSATLQAGASGALPNNLSINSGATGTLDTQANSVTLSGIVGGSGALIKTGSGMLILSASSTYNGVTTVNAGTLAVAGSLLGGSTVAAENGGAISVSGNGSLSSGTVTADNGGTISLGGSGSLSAQNQFIGNSATGTVVQSGGVNGVGNSLSLGYLAGSSGTYSLSGSGLLLAYGENLGYSGTGTFTQSGGTNNVGSALYLGYNTGASGAYNLGGSSQLSASGALIVGYSGTATFSQSGGTNLSGALYLGNFAGGSGSYSLGTSGLLSISGSEVVGGSGSGTFNQFGGSNGAGNDLYLGYAGGSGAYSLTDGLLAESAALVGYSGMGAFTQSGGTHTIGNALELGFNSGSSGTYSLSGSGQLSAAGSLIVGYSGTATFAQSGGNNLVGSLYVGDFAGSSGAYSLSGGLLATSLENVGVSGTGSFTQTGGTNGSSNSLALYLGSNAGGGTYNLSSGLVSASSVTVRSGAFTQSGGSNSISGSLLLDCSAGNNSAYNLSGSGQVSAYIEYVGELGQGSFSHSGGTNTIGNYLYLGYLAGSSGTYGVSGGQLVALSEYVGYSGAGTFTQSGGNNSCSSLVLGGSTGGSGTYGLSGSGQLSASSEYVTGTFIQSGGTHGISSLLLLGNNAGSSGTYVFSGGQLSAPYEFVGGSGAGSFTQSGGANSIGSTLALGLGASGAYNLSGSGQLSAPYELVGGSQPGTFTQSGGTNTVSSGLDLGNGPAGGTYNLNGGVLVLAALGQGSGSAALNFNGGTLLAGNAFSTTVPMKLGVSGGGATFDTAGFAVTLAGPLSGSGGLAKVDSGTLTLATANTYGGATLLTAGTLVAGAAGALPAGSAVSITGGLLDVTSASQTVFALTIGTSAVLNINVQHPLSVLNTATFASGSSVNISGSIVTPELLMTYGSVSGTLSNVNYNGSPLSNIGDTLSYSSGSLEIVGMQPADWIASSGSWSEGGNWSTNVPASGIGVRTALGGTANSALTVTLDAPQTVGTLVLGNSGSASTDYTLRGSPLTLNNSSTSTVAVLGGTHTVSSPVEIADGSLDIVLDNSGGLSVPGNISDDNGRESLTLAGDGSGQLILSGAANTYGGGTNVEAGTLIVSNSGALLAGSSLTVGADGMFLLDGSASGFPIETGAAATPSAVPEPSAITLSIAALLMGAGLFQQIKRVPRDFT